MVGHVGDTAWKEPCADGPPCLHVLGLTAHTCMSVGVHLCALDERGWRRKSCQAAALGTHMLVLHERGAAGWVWLA